MRLKSLELQGFKSFPDKTKITVDAGMTVIVGPNGSGKSNISDAIRFVLGEVSSKNIRGNKMEDVIFGGTDSRRPMGFAAVSLTFDNTEGDMALPLEYDEVTITRKYFRAGHSEYYIGGKPARLKDITELFMNTGLGKSGYSMIGQGRIAEIISKKSEDRRGIFEEAAGISKYRYQKSEAEKKQAETEENLSRVTDILTELEGRVGPLEKDAAKAKKYLELFEQKKKADVSLWLYEIDHILEQTKKLQDDYEIARHSLEMAEDSIRSIESQIERAEESNRSLREKAEDTRLEIVGKTEEKHSAESNTLLMQRDMEHFSKETERVQNQIKGQEAEGKKAADALAEATARKADAEGRLAEIDGELRENAALLEAIRASLLSDEEQAESIRDDISLRTEALTEARMELTTLEGSDENAATRREELCEEAETLAGRIQSAGERALRGEQSIAAYQKKIGEIQEQEEEYNRKIKEKEGEKLQIAGALDEEKIAHSVVEKRIEALERMEAHFEGYASSVRFVMEQKQKGTLRGICGPVSTLLSVEERYTVAIETVLGGNLQNIVVESEADAKAAIRRLKEEKAGRATFYPIDIMRPDPLKLDYDRLEKQSGFIGLACDLVTTDGRYRDIADYLLCRSVVCTDLDHAAAISKAFDYQFRTVTLDGQVVNAGGSFTGGSMKQESGMLSRRTQIEKLRRTLRDSAEKLADLQKKLSAVEKEIVSLEGEKESSRSGLEMLRVLQNAEDTQLKILEAQIGNDREQQEKIAALLASLDEQSERYLRRMEEARQKIAEKEAAVKEAEDMLAAAGAEEKKHQEALDAAIEAKNEILLRRGASLKDGELALRDENTAMSAISAASIAVEALSQELSQLGQRTRKAKTSMESNQSTLEELSGIIAALENAEKEVQVQIAETESRLEALRKQQKERDHEREVFFRDFTKLETKLGGITEEQDKYTTRLWDEYELSYSAATALEYPKLTVENRTAVVAEQTKLRTQIRSLGNVNVGAIEEYKEVKERFDFLSGQYRDLTDAKENLAGIIFRLEKEMRIRFEDTFAAVNEHFKLVFMELFGGGTAELRLTDPDHPLESGIEINVAPPGKIIKSLSLLSGGEQVFVAIALFFAILKVTPAPFCLLDEIEAALDEVNVSRFASYAKRFSDKTQFIIISHRRGTMEEADALYGVTMQERGISKILSINVNEVEAKLGEKPI